MEMNTQKTKPEEVSKKSCKYNEGNKTTRERLVDTVDGSMDRQTDR